MTDATPTPPPPAPAFNAENIERALIDAQGDLFVAGQLLGHVTMMKVDRAIRADDRLQAVYLAIKEVKANGYDKMSQERLELEVARRMTFYRADGLEAIHELATMPIGDNSAMAQVKLAAAARLTGPMGEREGSNELQETLRQLNESYHQEAKRIKITRQTSIEIGPEERVIDSTSTPE